jgi:hypothetical protein
MTANHHIAQFDQLPRMQATFFEQRQQIARLGQRGRHRIDGHQITTPDRRLRQLLANQGIRAGCVDVRSGFQPVGIEQRLCRRRDRAEQVATAHGFLGTGGRHDSNAGRFT